MPKTKPRLKWCWNCKENSVAQKTYTRTDKQQMCVEFCLNKGCGYKTSHPIPLVIHNADGISIVNTTHHAYLEPKQDVLDCGMTGIEAERYCLYLNADCLTYCVREDKHVGF